VKLSLGFSPCPNDCFIFDALIHHKIDTEDFEFEVVLEDVEKLNQRAISALHQNQNISLHITKLSYHAFTQLTEPYVLLNSGSALGSNCGPLLISKKNFDLADVEKLSIAIPGRYTTANFLLSFAFPSAKKKQEILFSEIENSILNDSFDAGLLIHETRFTYAEKGLKKIMDLGEFWETETGLPIPLGGIVIQRNLPTEIKEKVERLLRKSIEFAFANPKSSADFVRKHAQEMSEEVQNKHIALYVNEFTIDLGEKGKKAIKTFFEKAIEHDIVKKVKEPIFLT
jgi:1,4-dihydroxy-6-naphthoate synthase